jgi:hypothetical protein
MILAALNHRLGYADPASCKYLFIGIEEGGGPYELVDFPLEAKPLDLWPETVSKAKGKWSPLYTITSKIVTQVENIADLDRFQTTQMCHQGDVTGLMNLLPLPKKSVDTWPYKTLTLEQYQEWLFDALRGRYAAIRHEISKMPNLKATVCFGSTNWLDFINCLALSWDEYTEKDGLRIYPVRRIILTPFFQSRYGTVSDITIPRFVEAIKSFSN